MLISNRKIKIISLIAVLFSISCGTHLNSKLKNMLDAKKYKAASMLVKGDFYKAKKLAVLILENSAKIISPDVLIRIIDSQGRDGKKILVRFTKNDDPVLSALAKISLDKKGKPSDKILAGFLSHDSSLVRTQAAKAWAKHLDNTAALNLLEDPESKVRISAVKTIATRDNFKDREELFELILLRDPEPKVRSAVAMTGDKLGSNTIWLLKRALKDTNSGVRMAAVKGLAKINAGEAITILQDLLSQESLVKTAAAAELARKNLESGIFAMRDLLNSKEPVIRTAALLRVQAARLKNPNDIYAKALKDPSCKIVIQACVMLKTHDDFKDQTVNALQKIFKLKVSESETAAIMLAELGIKSGLKYVKQILKSDDAAQIKNKLEKLSAAKFIFDEITPLMGHHDENIRIEAAKSILRRK